MGNQEATIGFEHDPNNFESKLKNINENTIDNMAEIEKKNSLNQFRSKYFSHKNKE